MSSTPAMAPTSGGASSAINPNNYDPISNLEKQYAYPPLGRRLTLVVKLNQQCLIPGGVETVLRHQGGGGGAEKPQPYPNQSVMEAAIANSINDATGQGQGVSMGQPPTSDGTPFEFLHEEANAESALSPTGSTGSSNSGRNKMFATFGSRIKNQIDRQFTNLAIQAQKVTAANGEQEIRDLLTLGAYAMDSSTGEYSMCIGMTENAEIPDDVETCGNGMAFHVPIIVPPHLFDQRAVQSGDVIQLHLWMRSGAAIFAKNRALRSYYTVGTATLPMSQVANHFSTKSEITLNLQSTVAANAQVTLVPLPDTKHPSLCGMGWSLTDPRVDTAYKFMPNEKKTFNAPLEQSYVFGPRHTNSTNILFTTERVTESAIVLPLAVAYSKLVSDAIAVSTRHAQELASSLHCVDDAISVSDPMKAIQRGFAQCQVQIMCFLRYNMQNTPFMGGGRITANINLQRPDSIFENCLANGSIPLFSYIENMTFPTNPTLSVPFFPRLVSKSDPRLLPGYNSNKGTFLGKLRIQLYEDGIGGVGSDVFSPIGPAAGVATSPRKLEALVDIDPFLNKDSNGIIQAPVLDISTAEVVGLLVMQVSANTMEGMVDSIVGSTPVDDNYIEGGVVSLVGMDTLLEDDKSCYPRLDLQADIAKNMFSSTQQDKSKEERMMDRRKRQIATMGEFVSYDFLDTHTAMDRTRDCQELKDMHAKYEQSLLSPVSEEDPSLPPDKRKSPKPFRPSSTRMDADLSCIGFNIHVQTFNVSSISSQGGTFANTPKVCYQNVTCGAPADHFRGFGSKNKEEKTFSGGLRRLEASRLALSQQVRDAQGNLIEAVANYFDHLSKQRTVTGRSMRHVPPSDPKIAQLRKICIDSTQMLHKLNWDVAVRRGKVFSQALGIAMTSYLSHVSDYAKMKSTQCASRWKTHGFLITYEGLLSAAGKELGMIEDASVGISMLRMVSVVLVSENDPHWSRGSEASTKVAVTESPYLQWVKVVPSGKGSKTTYRVEVGLDPKFYKQRIPPELQNGTAVQFYPMLYQMGVDIRQWGANAGANMRAASTRNNSMGMGGLQTEMESGIMQDELDDDEVGIPDNDVLLALNYEAFRKMNAYAHAVYPEQSTSSQSPMSWEDANVEQQVSQPIHSMLAPLHEFIRSSAGKMEHGILDEAAYAAAKLGGGSAIFCKSGKDRTAMQVTFKQSQFINRFIRSGGNGFAEADCSPEKIAKDVIVMRINGTRLPICEKNVGQALYAFNSLQAKFMPDMLKPPPRALAGFLKGGRVFSREGIES